MPVRGEFDALGTGPPADVFGATAVQCVCCASTLRALQIFHGSCTNSYDSDPKFPDRSEARRGCSSCDRSRRRHRGRPSCARRARRARASRASGNGVAPGSCLSDCGRSTAEAANHYHDYEESVLRPAPALCFAWRCTPQTWWRVGVLSAEVKLSAHLDAPLSAHNIKAPSAGS
jgi:hypothetical protein